jgi:hypothetical protein
MASYHLKRLEAFKTGTGPYAGSAGECDRAEREAEQRREERAALRRKVAEQAMLRAERNASVAAHRAFSKRLKQGARALPCVYGTPPGSEAVKASVRRAKALCREMPPMQALEACVVDCALVDVVEAVLAMRGATP